MTNMRLLITLCEAAESTLLYHGTSLDDLWGMINDGTINAPGGDSHATGVSLTRSLRIAVGHAESDVPNMAHSFYDYFGLDDHDLWQNFQAVLVYNKQAIQNEIVPVDDMGDDSEEEERAIGSLPFHIGLVGIYLSKQGLHTYINEVARAKQTAELSTLVKQEYGAAWKKTMRFLQTSPLVKEFPR
jgi:hypothetical protein